MPGSRGIIAARTYSDARDTCVEDPSSGLRSAFSDDEWSKINWNRSLGELTHPNGSYVKLLTSEKPDSFRGKQAHWAWCDELASWLKHREAWGQMPYVVRLQWPADPARAGRVVVTTTPRPFEEIRKLIRDDGRSVFDERLGADVTLCRVSRGSTYDNWDNLNTLARAELEKLKGTRQGRQELFAELLDDAPGALWTRTLVERQRVDEVNRLTLTRIVVGVDPAVTANEDSDETGIVVAGIDKKGQRYVLEDGSLRGTPEQWASRVVELYLKWEADAVVPEVNQGGDMVSATIRAVNPGLAIRPVRASRGKTTRAEPIATAYERGNVWHCGAFPRLEDQMCAWVQGDPDSPDRMDALVWALTDLEARGSTATLSSTPRRSAHGPNFDSLT